MKQPGTILLCTLGGSWPVVAEIYAALQPATCTVLESHPDPERLAALRGECGNPRIDEVRVITSDGERADQQTGLLRSWWDELGAPCPLRVFRAHGTSEVSSELELRRLRELTVRCAMHAGPDAVLSLAGGRKTMSADLQRAANFFGCRGLLHIVAPEPLPDELRSQKVEDWLKPLPREVLRGLAPTLVGRPRPSDLKDVVLTSRPVLTPRQFPLPDAASDGTPAVFHTDEQWLQDELAHRERESGRVLGNYVASLAGKDRHDNWPSLLRLPPAKIRLLRETRIGEAHLPWLRALPKADLHCHVGGVLDLAAQKRVGEAVWAQLDDSTRRAALAQAAPCLGSGPWPADWPSVLRQGDRAANTSAVLVEHQLRTLEARLFPPNVRRRALLHEQDDFRAYEQPGDLSGSALLCHPAALIAYAREAVRVAREATCWVLELRGSPAKYRPDDPVGWLSEFRAALEKALADQAPGEQRQLLITFLVIVDRRSVDRSNRQATIAAAVEAAERWPDFVVGLDVAGDESKGHPAELAEDFEPAFRACLPITQHAGEGEAASNIWEASYRLHADRIGHGLTLIDDTALQGRFRNRGICLEMCPSSNLEVVGFRDPEDPSSNERNPYPLTKLWREGLPLTLCTDNPGISRTDLTREYLVASRLCDADGGLSLWDGLAIARLGFEHAFMSAGRRRDLLREADAVVLRLCAGQLSRAGTRGEKQPTRACRTTP